jgi:CRP-like cAMP-binding protein
MFEAAGQIEQVTFKPGELLFKENEQSYHFFIIQEGEVEIFKTSEKGEKYVLAVVKEGTAIGEFAMIDRRPRSATACAIGTVQAARVSEQAYEQLLSELPDWAVSVMRALVERLRQTNEIVRQNGAVSASTRKQIDTVEFDPDAGTIIDESPLLGSAD